MCKSFTCLLKCACVEATRKMINPQDLSQFLSMLECVLINSLRQVIRETHGILNSQLPCYRQMEDKMLVVSNSGTQPDLFSPQSKELLASWAQMTVSAEALISPPSVSRGLPFQRSCSAGVKVKNCIWPPPIPLKKMISLLSLCLSVSLILLICLQKLGVFDSLIDTCSSLLCPLPSLHLSRCQAPCWRRGDGAWPGPGHPRQPREGALPAEGPGVVLHCAQSVILLLCRWSVLVNCFPSMLLSNGNTVI